MTAAPVIDRFDGAYEFLSNFFAQPTPCLMGGIEFPTVEHAFQAAKTTDRQERFLISQMKYAGTAKRAGRRLRLRDGWDGMRVTIMHQLVAQKFSHDQMLQRLSATAPATLIEGNTWGDRFWGQVDGAGENHLGRILMAVRDGACLSVTEHDVEPEPHPTFLGGKSWTCPRCCRMFSEVQPTFAGGLNPLCDTAMDDFHAAHFDRRVEMTALTPNPGSREAIDAGCKCPIYDNAHGAGRGFHNGAPVFVTREDCPLHGIRAEASR